MYVILRSFLSGISELKGTKKRDKDIRIRKILSTKIDFSEIGVDDGDQWHGGWNHSPIGFQKCNFGVRLLCTFEHCLRSLFS